MDILIKNTMLLFFYFFSIVIFIFGVMKTNAKSIDSEDVQRNATFPESANNQSKAEEMCEKYIKKTCKTHNPTTTTPVSNSTQNTYMPSSIIGGRPAKPKEYPHMALIGIDNQWLCGGSLISENFVLTAAHCTETMYGIINTIRLGELDLTTGGNETNAIDYPITTIIVHPNYNPMILDNDIALLKFKGLTSFTDYIRPICLNTLDNIPGQDFFATGWGVTEHGNTSSKLLSVDLYPQDYQKCQSLYFGFDNNIMLCFGNPLGRKDTCQGDSGGPLQIVKKNSECPEVPIFTQFGITSQGEGCALPETPAVYTRVSYFIPWIESIVWE